MRKALSFLRKQVVVAVVVVVVGYSNPIRGYKVTKRAPFFFCVLVRVVVRVIALRNKRTAAATHAIIALRVSWLFDFAADSLCSR